jgi:hypothetical protein
VAAKAAPPWRQSKVRLGRSIKLSAGIQTPRNENDLRAGLQNHTPFHASRCATRMKTQWKSTVGILGVLHWMYRPCRRPDSIGSAHRSVTYRCWPSGHCGLHLCNRFLLSDGHTSPGGATHDGRRNHPSVRRSPRLGAIRGWRSLGLIGPKKHSLLETLARPFDDVGVALGTIAHRARLGRRVQSAIRRPCREGVHTGSQYMGAAPSSACL